MSTGTSTRVVVATDKFRATATVSELGTAIRASLAGVECDVVALSDGGEGFRAVFSGETLGLRVRGPWGEFHDAPMTTLWTQTEWVGVIEVAEIIGRDLRDSPSPHEALRASSAGVGDALLQAADLGVDRVVVGCGGSATSDGGVGCFDVCRRAGLRVALTAATDIRATYMGALRYAEQKGVARRDLEVVERRLRETSARFLRETGRSVEVVERAGAAGGVAGALFALGAQLVSGFDEVARVSRLAERIAAAQVVVTGEGRLDGGSLEGKVVAGVCDMTTSAQRVLVVCGAADPDAVAQLTRRHPWVEVRDLVSRYGEGRARSEAASCAAEVVKDFVGV